MRISLNIIEINILCKTYIIESQVSKLEWHLLLIIFSCLETQLKTKNRYINIFPMKTT